MKRILIISPVGDFGGRELEVGFIASIFSKKYKVEVLSTGNFTKKTQIKSFKGFTLTSLNKNIFNNFFYIRVLLKFMSFFLKKYTNNEVSLSNPLIKKIFSIEKKKKNILNKYISNSDLVFICAQVTSNYLDNIILMANNKKKPLVFRTTGFISKSTTQFAKKMHLVDLFIHHSHINAKRLNSSFNYQIIDQCAFNEDRLLEIPLLQKKVNNFMTISRIDKDKNIDVVINAFIKSKDENDRLYVVGNGPELQNLISQTKDKRVIFTNFISNNELQKYFKICECFIVSYYKLEAGPLTAIEAMAAGKIIISSKTGAMTERLKEEDSLWHNNNEKVLYKKMLEVKKFNISEITQKSFNNRQIYCKENSKKVISKKYIEVVENCI